MTDITAPLRAACQALPISQGLIKHPTTTLLDAMNALPFFDPALDTGIAPAEKFTPLNLSLDRELVSDAWRCAVIDKLLQLETSFHLGATLCDTVYTSIYYHHPEAVTDESLRSYLLAYVKSIELVYNEFARGNVVDGEDVWLDHHGVPIGLAESVQQIIYTLAQAIDNEPSKDVQQRLLLRKAMLQLFDAPGTPLPEVHYSDVPPGISVTRYIRQSAPLPPSTLHDPRPYLQQLDLQLQSLHGISTISGWQSFTKTSLVPYVRSVAAGKIGTIDNAFYQLSGLETAGIWKSIADGCAIATVRIPLQNRARQRRSYLSIAHSWNERATAAFSANDRSAFRASHALRLDCLLEATLAGYHLDLYHPSEYAQTMWWIYSLTSARCSLGPDRWAEIWSHISLGISKMLSANPLAAPASRERFLLRHKWSRKTPYPRAGKGLSPRWEEWKEFDAQLKTTDGTSDLVLAEKLLADPSLSHLADLRKEVVCIRTSSGAWKRGEWLYIPG